MIKTIQEMFEDDFGCEGRPEDEEAMVNIVLSGQDGKRETVRMADRLAYARRLDVGAKVTLAEDGTVVLVAEQKE